MLLDNHGIHVMCVSSSGGGRVFVCACVHA